MASAEGITFARYVKLNLDQTKMALLPTNATDQSRSTQCEGENRNTSSLRQARSRKARADAGAKQIAVMLSPKAAAKLAKWQSRGESIAGVVNRLLEKSRP